MKVIKRDGRVVDFDREKIKTAIETLKEKSKENGFTLAEARDIFHSSRKFVLPLLEYLDNEKVTKRVGDKRYFL